MKKCLVVLGVIILSACGSTHKSTAKKEYDTKVVNENMEQKLQDGIDFFAKGELPASWSLEIAFDKAIRFKSLDGSNIIASSVKPEEAKEQKLIRFTTNTDKGSMIVSIYAENCSSITSKEQYNRKVTVEVNGKIYTGCGQFLYSSSLNGKWVLDQLKGEKVVASDFAKGLPEIELNPVENKLTGHDGCNRIFGDAEVWGSLIKFGTIASTKMACIGKKESNFVGTLSGNTVSYKILNGQLMIYLPDDSIAVFNKK